MTIFHGTFLDVPDSPFTGGTLRTANALLVRDGVVAARGTLAELRRSHPGEQLVDLTAGLVLPGFVDTHVHFPQVRMIGALGMPLLDWLERSALPEEARLADVDYARDVARDFLTGLVRAGTTTALVFGAHYPAAVDVLFSEASQRGVRVTAGLVVSDRVLRDDLLTTPERAYDEGRALAERWHGSGRLRYAVTPRFSLSCSDALLDSCGALHKDVDGSWFTSHINENLAEIAAVTELFPDSCRLPRDVRPISAGRRAKRLRPQPPPVGGRTGRARPVPGHRRPLPDEQLRPRQWPFPAARARRERCPSRAGIRCRRRHRAVAAQGRPAGVLHAAAVG